jgi:hypothetical protein
MEVIAGLGIQSEFRRGNAPVVTSVSPHVKHRLHGEPAVDDGAVAASADSGEPDVPDARRACR